MRTTIDKAGRMTIPAAIRARSGLEPGTEIEVRLARNVPRPRLVRVRGRWVARPTESTRRRPPVDVAEWIEAERRRWTS